MPRLSCLFLVPFLALTAPVLAGDAAPVPTGVWRLEAMDSQPMMADYTLNLDAAFSGSVGMARQISGKAACNRYVAAVEAEYPAFAVGPVLATKMACDDQQNEAAYFGVLGEVTSVEWSAGQPDRLALSDATGVRLEFVPAPESDDEAEANRDG